MLANIQTVGIQVLVLFLLIIVGFICAKTQLLKEGGVQGITDLLLFVVSPCVIIRSYQREYDPTMLKGLLLGIFISIVSIVLTIVLSNLTIHNPDKQKERVLRFGAIFSNCGFMSIPLQSALLGPDGVFYGASYIVVFNVMTWTYGLAMMSGGIKNITWKKIVFNPGIMGTLFGLFCFLVQIKLPAILLTSIGYIADLNTALPMIVIGYHLASNSLQMKGFSTFVSFIIRLIVSPLITVGLCLLLHLHGALMISMVIASSAPYAAMTTMLSAKYKSGDTGLSAAAVSLSTLLSILTMPLIVGLAMMFA